MKSAASLYLGGLSHFVATDTEVLRKIKRTLNKNKIKTNVTTHILDSRAQSRVPLTFSSSLGC